MILVKYSNFREKLHKLIASVFARPVGWALGIWYVVCLSFVCP